MHIAFEKRMYKRIPVTKFLTNFLPNTTKPRSDMKIIHNLSLRQQIWIWKISNHNFPTDSDKTQIATRTILVTNYLHYINTLCMLSQKTW